MKQRKRTTCSSRLLIALSFVAVAYLPACATNDAAAQDYDLESNYDVDEEVELTFSDIEVEDRSRRLEVEYTLQDRDWRWARDNEYDLWLTLYAPSGGDYVFVHGMPLQSYRGRVLFPNHVRYYDYPYVGLCVVAVGVGEVFEPGYGYVCEDPVRVTIRKRQKVRWYDTRVNFTLGFHYGLYSYPWFHPYYGFYYPRYYYGPYPPRAIIHYGKYRHYYPRHHRRDYKRHDKYDRRKDYRDRYDRRRDYDRRDRRDRVERRRREPTRPAARPDQRNLKFRSPTRVEQRERQRRAPTRPRIERPTINPQRVTPRQVRPQQIRPQQIRPQQVRPQQVRPQQVRPQRIQPRQHQIRPRQQRIRGTRPATRPRQPTRGTRPPTRPRGR
ncbi:hypothetical protein FIV42_19225 [Persicimonas caeni]|uniref:DUF3300 domain-containing protein n=1 Tax=Persicimonas caeni TaxID=2292766 RepID=A0A4Y6PXS4_PERCE|nr:proline-rich domain-containing protein [Persicimonas caeni]QDG52797.1 hypothetical protein FIV42_19225 [Persicimonas caeni]QED34019.1 hypothetical protein FRD00_19220 [Persicimonas caeni]